MAAFFSRHAFSAFFYVLASCLFEGFYGIRNFWLNFVDLVFEINVELSWIQFTKFLFNFVADT